MVTLLPNLSITLSQQRWTCVLDPNLFLSQYGLWLVRSLGAALELWVARELWHILDNADFYAEPLKVTRSQTAFEPWQGLQTVAQQNRIQVLKGWESLRAETPPDRLNLFWLGDRPGESWLPEGTDPALLGRWEALAQSLDERSQRHPDHALTAAFRDTVALASVLGSAFILTYQPEATNEIPPSPPEICLVLEQWGISCHEINPLDAIAVMEREHLLKLIISTGFSKYLWAGLHLVVLHLIVPSASIIHCNTQSSEAIYSFEESNMSPELNFNIWEGAQGFWYKI